ncbi:MAG: OOP family OmpA-OmpF porin [Yoonia sp.]|jgi:OOP family OmpA-OmpF porin
MKEPIMNNLFTTKAYASLKLSVLVCAVMLFSACVSNEIITVESSVKQLKKLYDLDHDGVIKDRDDCVETTLGAFVENNGCGREWKELKTLDLDVKFEEASFELSDTAQLKIEELADFLNKYPDLKVQLEGHTSSVGSASSNQVLSEERANTVVAVLVNKFNISADRVSGKGFGFESLKDPGDSPAAHAINRRLEASVSKSVVVEQMIWTIYSVD